MEGVCVQLLQEIDGVAAGLLGGDQAAEQGDQDGRDGEKLLDQAARAATGGGRCGPGRLLRGRTGVEGLVLALGDLVVLLEVRPGLPDVGQTAGGRFLLPLLHQPEDVEDRLLVPLIRRGEVGAEELLQLLRAEPVEMLVSVLAVVGHRIALL